jgi:hypothetical protein
MSVIVSEAIRQSKFYQRVVFTYTPLRERSYWVDHLFPAYVSLSTVGRPRICPFRFTLGQYYNYTSRSVWDLHRAVFVPSGTARMTATARLRILGSLDMSEVSRGDEARYLPLTRSSVTKWSSLPNKDTTTQLHFRQFKLLSY